MDNKKFEKRRRWVEGLFDILFMLKVVDCAVMLFYKIAYIVDFVPYDLVTYVEICLSIIVTICMFISARLAHKGHIAAGIIGLCFGLINFLCGGLIGIILGLILAADSVTYLIYYKKWK